MRPASGDIAAWLAEAYDSGMAEALLELIGWFWRAATPEKKARGHLTIDGAGRILLKVSGSLRDDFYLYFGTSPRNDGLTFYEQHLIHGDCGQPVTLYQCQRIYGAHQGTEYYEAISALTGGHFEEDPHVNLVKMQFANLANWVGWKPDLVASSKFKFREKESQLSLSQRDGELVIKFSLGDQHSLQEINTLCSHIQMLGGIGLNDEAPLTKVFISHEKGDRTYEFFTSEMKADNSVDSKEYFWVFKQNTLFHFNDIGGVDGLVKWIEIAEKFYPVILLLKDSRKNSTDYVEINTIRNMIATETFSKIKYGKKLNNSEKNSFKNRLKILAKCAGDIFFKEIDADRWAKTIVQSRNNSLIHRNFRDIDIQQRSELIRKFYWLSESLYYILVLCLLREAGVPEATRSMVQGHGMIEWVAEEVRRYL